MVHVHEHVCHVSGAGRTGAGGNLLFGVICMMLIANLQYGWTLFVQPITKAHGWKVADIQLAFSIFIALETWLTPAGGWRSWTCWARGAGRSSPSRWAASWWPIGWAINAYADTLTLLYIGSAVTGIGAGLHLCDLRRHCRALVSGPARPGGGADRGGLRRRVRQ